MYKRTLSCRLWLPLLAVLLCFMVTTAPSAGELPISHSAASASSAVETVSSGTSNAVAMERAWAEMLTKPHRLAPVSGAYPTPDGYQPFVHIPIETLMDDDILPLELITVHEYRTRLEARLEEGGEKELIYLERMVYGNTAKWMSGANEADFRFVDGKPLLPPEWSIAHELLLSVRFLQDLQA